MQNRFLKPEPKRPRGRPVERPMPEPIPDTPEGILKTVLAGPPKKQWRYLEQEEQEEPEEAD